MEIVDSKGMYTILVDKRRRIVYEKNVGIWTSEDFERFLYDYNMVFDTLGNDKPWGKLCNLSEYEVSSIYKYLIEFLELSVENGYTHCAIISDNPITNAQMHETCKKAGLNYSFFDGIDAFEDAINWLDFNGYILEKPHYA